MVIQAGEYRRASEVHFASVTGVVCVDGPVPAVYPKDECSQCWHRAYVLRWGSAGQSKLCIFPLKGPECRGARLVSHPEENATLDLRVINPAPS